jgi:hypothetical protein
MAVNFVGIHRLLNTKQAKVSLLFMLEITFYVNILIEFFVRGIMRDKSASIQIRLTPSFRDKLSGILLETIQTISPFSGNPFTNASPNTLLAPKTTKFILIHSIFMKIDKCFLKLLITLYEPQLFNSRHLFLNFKLFPFMYEI